MFFFLSMFSRPIHLKVLDTVTPLKIALCSNLLNVVLDPMLIFWAKMGVAGAALATMHASFLLFGGAPAFYPAPPQPPVAPSNAFLPRSARDADRRHRRHHACAAASPPAASASARAPRSASQRLVTRPSPPVPPVTRCDSSRGVLAPSA